MHTHSCLPEPRAVTVHPRRDPGGPRHCQERVFPPHNSLVGKGQPGVWEICTDIPDQTLTWLWASFLRSPILFLQLSNEHNTASLLHTKGFPNGSVVKTQPTDTEDTGSIPGWVGRIPWRRAWLPTPVFLPEKPHGQRNLVGYIPKYGKESDTTEWLHACLRYKPSSWELSKRRTCVWRCNAVSPFMCLAYTVMCLHPLRVAAALCTLLCTTA